MRKAIYAFVTLAALAACSDSSFDRLPKTKVAESQEMFETESGLKTYSYSFYNNFDAGVILGDFTSDNCEHIGNPPAIRQGIYSNVTSLGSGGWSWTQLRNINYFIDHCTQSSVSASVKNRYLGLARFFRAKFYFEKVKSFGDVPWYSHPLDNTDEDELYKARDPRTVVMDSVVNDLDAAIQYLGTDKKLNEITRWTALAMKSRVCLYEGTWRKYHTEAGLTGAERFLQLAEQAAAEVIQSGQYKLYSTGNPQSDYAAMFQADEANTDEVIYARSSRPNLQIYYTPMFTSTSNGNYGATYSIIEDYPMADGRSFFEAYPDAATRDVMPYYEEVKNRDPRLRQTIICPGYVRVGTNVTSSCDFAENRTGYQITKRVGTPAEDQGSDSRDVILFRYAEVLLNYAEAKAEQGTLTQQDVDLTINALRARVGLPARTMPLTTDDHQREIYTKVTDPNILEVRRERRIELAFEGFRTDDIKRWAEGHLFRDRYEGIYISHVSSYIDLNGDGSPDLYILTPSETMPTQQSGVQYMRLSAINGLSNGESGRLVPYNKTPRKFEDWEYLNPIPTEELTLNPQLKQNPGWENQ